MNPRTVGEWEAVGFRIVEAGEIDRYPAIRFEPPQSKRSTQRAARLRKARGRTPRDATKQFKNDTAFRNAIRAADRRAAIYNRERGLDL